MNPAHFDSAQLSSAQPDSVHLYRPVFDQQVSDRGRSTNGARSSTVRLDRLLAVHERDVDDTVGDTHKPWDSPQRHL